MTSNPTAQNSGLPNNKNSSTPSSTNTFPFSNQNPSISETSSSASRFNSFSLPYRSNPHTGASETVGPPPSSAAFVHNPFTNPTVAEPASRHHSISSTASNIYPQQQQSSSQLLSSSSTTPSSSSFTGSAAKTAGGGGGGSSSAGSGVPNLSLGQIHLLIATINDRNYETKRKEIQRITDSNMDVNGRVLRKLISDNYSYILAPSGSRGNDFRILADMIKNIAGSPQTSKEKFADAINPDTLEPSKAFKDFDLTAFFNSMGLDPLQRCVLAVGFKDHENADLRQKGLDVLQKAFHPMLDILANPSKHPEMTADGIAHFVHVLVEGRFEFLDNSDILKLSYAVRSRYKHTALPPTIFNVTEPIEHARTKESLVSTLQQSGPDCMRNLDNLKELLKRKGSVETTEAQVAEVLTLVAMWPNPAEWDSVNLVEALQAVGNLAQNFDWSVVIDHLQDREDFVVEGPAGFHVVFNAIKHGTKGSSDFPIHALWGGRWKYPEAQWAMLRAYIKSNELRPEDIPGVRKVFCSEDFETASSGLQLMVATLEVHKLISYDAVDALLYLAFDSSVPPHIADEARDELDRAAKFTPELILCGALMTPQPWSDNVNDVITALFDIFFEGHTSHQLIFWRLWQFDKSLVANRFLDHYAQDPRQISRILDISQDLRCLSDLLEVGNPHFVLDVASLAARREYLNLDKWIRDMLEKFGGDFWAECYRFLRLKADAEYQSTRENAKQTMVSLRVGPVHTFLTALDEARPPITQDVQEQVTQTQRVCIQAYPRLINLGHTVDAVILANNAEGNTFASHIDKDMQANYRKLYAQETDIRDLVNYMQELKNSSEPRDQDLFACMIHGLFDEYDCYPNYPIHALATTSVLFGSIIRFKVIDNIPLRVALAMVYQAVRDHTTSSSMYKFGLQALVQFKDRLREWRAYCALLAQVPGLQGTDVWNAVQDVVVGSIERPIEASASGSNVDQEEEVPELSNGNVLPETPPPAFEPFRCLHADPPLQDPSTYEDPSEDVQDKVLFILNNVSALNLDTKLKELREWLPETHYQWFADYLVVKRAKLEPNYQELYLELLEKFGKKELSAEVLRETYVNVIKILNSENTLSSSLERTHLKNLAVWLGGLTIAKDKPIKFKNISFKDLLIEAWETDRLIVALPFTCKVLEQAKHSTAFRPPNPWVMAVLRLLKELYDIVGKLNLKFEIEVLCRTLEIDITTIEPATDIQDIRNRQLASEQVDEDEAAMIALDTLAPQDYPSISNQIPRSFTDHIAINSVIRDPSIKAIIVNAIERTAHEIIGPVVERSVTIATIATSQLIQKDFATEPDENKMRNAAIGMAQRLAGHLALVTCKEPMRLSMVNNIRGLLAQAGYSDGAISEQAVTMIVNDNLDYVCQTVEAAAEQGAVPGVDETLHTAYQLRKRHRDQGISQAFISPDVSRMALSLPDVFRLKPGGLTPQQIGVYDEFARPSQTTNLEATRGQGLDGLPSEYLPGNLQGTPGLMETPPIVEQRAQDHRAPSPQPLPDHKSYFDKINIAIAEMRKVAKDTNENHLHNLRGADHPIFQYVDGILHHISLINTQGGSKIKEQICTSVASLICNMLYADAQGELEVESLVFLLRKLCELSPNTAKEVVMWLARDKEDDRIFNVLTTLVLLRSQLLSVPHLDNTLSKHINQKKPAALEFLERLLSDAQDGEPPLLYRTDFAASFNAVSNWVRQDPGNKVAQALWNDMQGGSDHGEIVEDQDRRDQLEYVFTEWIQLFQHISTTEKNYSAFVIQLHQNGVVANLDYQADFFRVCLEYCVSEYESSTRTGESIATNCYIPTDAFAKLVMLFVRYQTGDERSVEQMDKANYFDGLLALVVVIFNHQVETRDDQLSQKVFFRFFSSLLFEYRQVESYMEEYHGRIFEKLAQCFMTLQPAFFPTFTFHWVTLISHRYFMPKLLATSEGQPIFTKLLTTLLNYLGMLLKGSPDANVVRTFHQGALRLLLVIHHDFPGYLAEYYFPIVDAIPSLCTQLRNLILSALPPSMSDFPDPFSSGLQFNLLPEIKISPNVQGDIPGALHRTDLYEIIESMLQNNTELSNTDFGHVLKGLEKTSAAGDVTVDGTAINSLVLYVGMDAIAAAAARGSSAFDPDSVHTKLFVRLATDFKAYGRHFLLSAITNHLRFPNSHTYYFSNLIVYLFDCASGQPADEKIHEQTARVLMERLVVHRPHPWGLIITLIELFRHRQDVFWNMECVRQSDEIRRLLTSVLQQIDASPPR
ncbi:CCR4-Not complex component, Not1-domain-containing protein [Geopyxis carbonaria]|nr:CCR4-Not complex component, Not1-domain-containing protein [Geopyxis carbonaria]